MKFLYKEKLLWLIMIAGLVGALRPADLHAQNDPESAIECCFEKDAKSFAEFIDKTIDVLKNNTDHILRTRSNVTPTTLQNFILTLQAIRNAIDVKVVDRALAPYRHLLPATMAKKGKLAFVTRLKNLLKANSKMKQ